MNVTITFGQLAYNITPPLWGGKNKEKIMNDIVVKDEKKSVAHEMVSVIANMALNADIDADKLEKLMNVQMRMMDKQADIDFNQDFIAMQEELPIIGQKGAISTKGGGVTSRYSKFEDIMEAINPILRKYGFSFRHTTKSLDGGRIEIVTILTHKGGHKEITSFISPMDSSNALKSPMQAAKSTVSFGKRTNIISALNLQEASEDSEIYQNQTITTEQAQELENLIIATNSDRNKMLQLCGVDNMLDVKISKYKWAIGVLENKKRGIV